ncbi:hypothetical protein Ddc_23878 [Ditylenchus destructor]|nr:hypothetical protein Ddc_23878 [Ditylenchus destructor]
MSVKLSRFRPLPLLSNVKMSSSRPNRYFTQVIIEEYTKQHGVEGFEVDGVTYLPVWFVVVENTERPKNRPPHNPHHDGVGGLKMCTNPIPGREPVPTP